MDSILFIYKSLTEVIFSPLSGTLHLKSIVLRVAESMKIVEHCMIPELVLYITVDILRSSYFRELFL